MAKAHLKLQQSESVVVQAAAQIYSAYIAAGRVNEGEESNWMRRAIREAIQIANATDEAIVSDEEVDTLQGRQQLAGKLHIQRFIKRVPPGNESRFHNTLLPCTDNQQPGIYRDQKTDH